MVALGIVLGIIYILAKVGVARFIPGGMATRSGKLVRVVERVAVDQKNSLVVVEVGSERLLLSAGERGVKMLAQLGPDQTKGPPQGQGEGTASFKTVLGASRVGKFE
ncbi:MAG: flagellar biosynthetic protein FliO [Clostridia bacterium]|nr:flagellar biosynthetic protein FliO [Deltaproteobacteria bacterium]